MNFGYDKSTLIKGCFAKREGEIYEKHLSVAISGLPRFDFGGGQVTPGSINALFDKEITNDALIQVEKNMSILLTILFAKNTGHVIHDRYVRLF